MSISKSAANATRAAQSGGAAPDDRGRFGQFGGRYVPETLVYALDQLAVEYEKARADSAFQAELHALLKHFVGRPSPLYHARRLSEQIGGAQIWLKREDLNHTGAHKINNTLGQALLTLRMKKTRVIAETGAGQHGVATATPCCPAPVSAITRFFPIFCVRRICPIALLILWAPVWQRSSRFR